MGSVISNFIYSYFMRNLETNVLDTDVGDNAIDDYYKLYMYIHDSDDGQVNTDLKNMYKESSKNNNELVDKYLECCKKNDDGAEGAEGAEGADTTIYCYNSGFDLFCPANIECTHINKYILDHDIACSMTYKDKYVGYYLYVRSSTPIKTPLRLANNVGIIDSGYRGNIKGCFDIIDTKSNFNFEKGNRYMQLCPPDIGKPMKVYIVDAFHNLGHKNNRYCGGFGSTGN